MSSVKCQLKLNPFVASSKVFGSIQLLTRDKYRYEGERSSIHTSKRKLHVGKTLFYEEKLVKETSIDINVNKRKEEQKIERAENGKLLLLLAAKKI